MTELTPAEVLVIEQEAIERYQYSIEDLLNPLSCAMIEDQRAAALPRELLLKQERERAGKLVEALEAAVKKYADEMTNPFCMDWYKKATDSLTQYKAKL